MIIPKAPMTLITPSVLHGVVSKGRITEGLIREFSKENLGKLDHLLSIEHKRLAKR